MNSRALMLALTLGLTAAVQAETLPDTVLASVDLRTTTGVTAVQAAWRYSDVRILPVEFPSADAQGQPTGAKAATFDYEPHAGGADFDDSRWPTIAPESLATRRGHGLLSFNWYRLRLTVPAKLGNFATRGTTLAFSTSLDDYAEVWVDGELPRATGQSGGSVVAGWNARTRLVIARNVQPGQTIQLAVFGINGPISAAPTNFIWMREARLEFTAATTTPLAVTPQEVNVTVERLDAALDSIVPANAKLFKLAEGFQFTEGPVWLGEGRLLFSDPNANRIYRYTEPGKLEVFREQSGYSGADIADYGQPGSNGLALDAQGRLTLNQHGNRRIVRLENDGHETVLAASYRGKRLNSPNDLVYASSGELYFTDPPFGLPKFADDPRRELEVFGVYRLHQGQTELLVSDLKGPNGIAFAPDEKTLYIGNWDPARKVVMRYAVRTDGSLDAGHVLYDMTSAPGEDAIDGIKVDAAGHLFVSGPGGIWILDAEGKHLGTLHTPKHAHNLAWGGDDGRTLYLTAQDRLYRIAVLIPGATTRTAR